MSEVKRPPTPRAAIPLQTFTFKDGDDEKIVECFTAEQVAETKALIEMRNRWQSDRKEELDRINAEWDMKRLQMKVDFMTAFIDTNKAAIGDQMERFVHRLAEVTYAYKLAVEACAKYREEVKA